MEVVTCVRIVDFRDWDESYLFAEIVDRMESYVDLRDDKILVCLYVKGKSTWKLIDRDNGLRMNDMHWSSVMNKMVADFNSSR